MLVKKTKSCAFGDFIMSGMKEMEQQPSDSKAVMRAQLRKELNNKKLCNYKAFECSLNALDGYNFCIRHILSDKNAPYKQCSYLYKTNGKRCKLPAPKLDLKELGYCNEHALKVHLTRAKQATKPTPPRSLEFLMSSLSHYVMKKRTRNTSVSSEDSGRVTPEQPVDSKVTKCLDPFVDIDVAEVNASQSDILNLCSESDSDVEPSTYANIWQDAHADSSEAESIDSDQEDPLKHANVYSAEEVTMITREKLIRLQSLYIDQYQHLQHVYREKRRRYLQALKREKETCCSISDQPRENPKEQRMYKKLKAYNHYHRKFGTDAILRKKLNEMRIKITEGASHKPSSYHTKCAFTEGGVKCTERALPVARHCRKHILEDPNQVLFKACGKTRADVECLTPVEAIFEGQTCPLHQDIPPIRCYNQIKDCESDTEEPLSQNPNVKAELLDCPSSDFPIPTSIINNIISNESNLNITEDEMEISLINNMYDPPNEEEISKMMDTDHSTLDCPESSESTLDVPPLCDVTTDLDIIDRTIIDETDAVNKEDEIVETNTIEKIIEASTINKIDELIETNRDDLIERNTDELMETSRINKSDALTEADTIEKTDGLTETDALTETELINKTDALMETDAESIKKTESLLETDTIEKTDALIETDALSITGTNKSDIDIMDTSNTIPVDADKITDTKKS